MAIVSCSNIQPLMKCLKLNSMFRSVNTTSVNFGFTGFKISDKLHSRQVAQEFIFKLSHRERTILLEELQGFQAQADAIRGKYKKSAVCLSSFLRTQLGSVFTKRVYIF